MPMRSVSPKRTRTRTMLRAAAVSIGSATVPASGAEEGLRGSCMAGGLTRPALGCPRVDTKRRLPIVKSPVEPRADGGGDDDSPSRPPWQWVGFGTVAIFVVWLPLAFLGVVAAAR